MDIPTVLGGSWVVISGVISPLIWVITIVTLLRTPLVTTHEPPSRSNFVLFGHLDSVVSGAYPHAVEVLVQRYELKTTV